MGWVILIGGLMALLLSKGAWLVGGEPVHQLQGKEQVDALNSVRQVLLAAAIACAAGGGLYFTGRTYFLSRRGHLLDRYDKASAQLASVSAGERMDGLYALERTLVEFPALHHSITLRLVAFVTEHDSVALPAEPQQDAGRSQPPPDLQLALRVIGHRPRRVERFQLSFAGLNLASVNLAAAVLRDAILRSTNLQQAYLRGADLRGAYLRGANLRGAYLESADLRGANLVGADLSGAYLQRANLRSSRLGAANLCDADLSGADLRDTEGLTQEQLDAAQTGIGTRLDPG